DRAQTAPSMRSASASEDKRWITGRHREPGAPSLTSSDALRKESSEYRRASNPVAPTTIAGSIRYRRCHIAGRHRLRQVSQNRQLLPDLARQAGRELLDVVDRVEQHRILKILHVKCSDLADQRQRVAAVIQVAAQFERRHLAFHRGRWAPTATEIVLR